MFLRRLSTLPLPQQIAKQVREKLAVVKDWQAKPSPFTSWSAFFAATQLDNTSVAHWQSAHIQTTAMLSYPVTLAWLMQYNDTPAGRPLHIHVIGARAEAMFPDFIWQFQSDIYTARQQKVHISLVGPMVVDLGSNNDRTIGNIRITHHPQTLYHDVVHDLPVADACVAFHPGWGQDEWKASWRPTLEIMMKNSDTYEKPLYFTSFDESDMLDDVAFLREMNVKEKLISSGTTNPFRSLHAFPHDDENKDRMIQVNNYVSGYRSKVVVLGGP